MEEGEGVINVGRCGRNKSLNGAGTTDEYKTLPHFSFFGLCTLKWKSGKKRGRPGTHHINMDATTKIACNESESKFLAI